MKLRKLKVYVRSFYTLPFVVVILAALVLTVSIALTVYFSPKQSWDKTSQELTDGSDALDTTSNASGPDTLIEAGTQAAITSTTVTQTDDALIRQSFDSYRNAALSNDGAVAVQFLTNSTIQYYDGLLHKTIYADEDSLRSDSVSTRFTVLLVRHIATKEEILALRSGYDFVVFAINNGLTGESGLTQIELGSVHVTGDEAFVGLAGPTASEEKLHFIRENGVWKMDLVQTIRSADRLLVQLADGLNATEEEFIELTLLFKNGKPSSSKIWQPIQ